MRRKWHASSTWRADVKARLLVLSCFWASTAFAAPDWRGMIQQCVNLKTDEEIAKCLRAGVKTQEAEEQADNDKQTAAIKAEFERPFRLLVRDTATSITNFAGKGLGEKGASLNALRDKGVDSTQAKVALFGVFKPVFGGRVVTFRLGRNGQEPPDRCGQ